jgi:hypothetical protein
VDFLGDAERWKLDWASHTRSHSFFFVFPNRPRARLVFQLKFSLLPRFRNNPIYEAVRSAGRCVGFKVHSD